MKEMKKAGFCIEASEFLASLPQGMSRIVSLDGNVPGLLMSFSTDKDFSSTDEVPAGEDSLHELRAALANQAASKCVFVCRPAEPEDEAIRLSDSSDHTFPYSASGERLGPLAVVEKLYLQQQLRNKEVDLKRREHEQIEMKDCTFQPNIHLRRPEANPKKFIREQQTHEARRQARLEVMAKAKAEEAAKHTANFRPALSPTSVQIAKRINSGKPLIQRLLTPKKTPDISPEVSYAHHPLVSPRANMTKRDPKMVHERLYQDSKRERPPSPPAPAFTASPHSSALVLRHFLSEFADSCATLEISATMVYPQFCSLLTSLRFADSAKDTHLLQDCWQSLAGRNEAVDTAKVREMLQAAVELRRDRSPQQKLVRDMHRVRVGSPSKYHQHKESWTHQPHIDSHSSSLQREDYLRTLQVYEERIAAKRSRQVTEQAALLAEQCSFSPKLNRTRNVNPLLKKLRSASPGSSLKRYEVLHLYGEQVREERRLLDPPDRDFEQSKDELTFAPKRFASVSPRRTRDYPPNYSKAVLRLQDAYARHVEVMKMFTRGEVLRSPPRRLGTTDLLQPVLKGRKPLEQETTHRQTK